MNNEPMEQPVDEVVEEQVVEEPIEETPAEEEPAAASGRAKLVLKRGGELTDVEFTFTCPATLGRFDPSVGPIDIDLGTIPEGSYVSRKHARFTFGEDGYAVEDLGSSNGTFVLRDDYERIEEATAVEDGTVVAFGSAIFVFHVAD